MNLPKPPTPPPGRIICEGTISRCDVCGSSLKRRWFGLGKAIGCLQPKCWNWHGWSSLPAGSNRPIDSYGAPEKPRWNEFGLPNPTQYPPMPPVKPPRAVHATGDICDRLARLQGDVLRMHGVDISDQVGDLIQFYREGGDTEQATRNPGAGQR